MTPRKNSAGHADLVAAACRMIEQSAEPPGLAALARAAGLSPSHFQRVFVKVAGLSPKAYALAARADRVRAALERTGSVTEAIYAAGFNSSGRFYESSSRILGMPPGRFRRGGAGEMIRFAVAECSLGALLVAGSGRGICCITLGDEADQLVRALQDRFPGAALAGDDPDFNRLVARVAGLVERPESGTDLPLDLRGTAFQRRVWSVLMKIPLGRTMSYAEVAEALGAPGSARAVAGACAANPIAVAVPCHRVVRLDGSLSGYRWGVERKRVLLAREAEAASA